MKNQTIVITVSILLLTIAVVGGTYAFFSATASSENLVTESSKFEVIFLPSEEPLEGAMNLITGEDDSEKISTTASIKMAEDSVLAKATIYIHVDEITSTLASNGFIWEVYGHKNGEQVLYKKGDFYGVNATTNNIVNIVEDYELSTDETIFTIYIWLDGNIVGNEVLGGKFKGHIGAKTENFTGKLQ